MIISNPKKSSIATTISVLYKLTKKTSTKLLENLYKVLLQLDNPKKNYK